MKNHAHLFAEVGVWSKKNFGGQETPHLSVHPETGQVQLGLIAPLLGIGEEIGELHRADDPEDTKDALGDIGIYLGDFVSRSGATIFPDASRQKHASHMTMVVLLPDLYGKLCHVVLKRMQGIRGMDDDKTYRHGLDQAVNDLLSCLEIYPGFKELLNEVWDKVSQRDWKKNSTTGGE